MMVKVKGRLKMTRKLKTVVVLMLVLGLSVVAFTGCSKDSGTQGSAKKQVVMGLDDTFAPMGFRDEKNEIVGFDVDLAKEVFKRNGYELKLQPIDWSMKETELNSGNIDMIWNAYTITDERKEKVAFTEPYLDNSQVIVVLADSEIKTKKDLAGKKVAAQTGSSAVDAMNTEPELVKAFSGGEPVLFDTNDQAFMDLEAERSDAVVADEVLARYYIKLRGVEKYRVLDEDFGDEEYGIGFRKDDKELLQMVENTLNDMRKDGTFDEIYQKWFGK
jgi:polar amino acid transport system substrate-binding protein